MAKVVHGRATLHGADGDITWSAITAGTVKEPQSADYDQNFEQVEAKDANGETNGIVAFNDKETLTINILPTAGSGADNTLAKANLAPELPAKMAVVTLSNFAVAAFNGTWNYAGGGKINKTNTGLVSMVLPLQRHGGAAFAVVSA
jgi:hypothetical protein